MRLMPCLLLASYATLVQAETKFPPLQLRLQEAEPELMQPRTPAAVLSPVFQSFHSSTASSAQAAADAELQKLRLQAQRAQLLASTQSACSSKLGNGGGIRWSSEDGFGFYLSGKHLKALQHAGKLNRLLRLCKPGDDESLCITLPKAHCE